MWTPEDIIQAIIRSQDDSAGSNEVINEVIERMERQAREIVREAGGAPHDWYLEGCDTQEARREWAKEAEYLMEGGESFITEQAATVLIGIDDLGWHLESSSAPEAALAMLKIVSCSLLPNDSERSELIHKMTPFAIHGKKMRGGKQGKRDALGKLIEQTFLDLQDQHGKMPTWRKVLNNLKNFDSEDEFKQTIQEISEDDKIIYWIDEKGKEHKTPYKALQNRLTEIKEKFK